MTNQEVLEALAEGVTRFVAKRSGRVYIIHSDQQEILKAARVDEELLLIGWPETPSATRQMRRFSGGRRWVYLAPKNIVPEATDTTRTTTKPA